MEHRVLGIDPGSRVLGFGVVDGEAQRVHCVATGVLKFSGRLPFATRLLKIHEGVCELIALHQPTAFAIEKAFVGESAQSSLKLGEARAVAILAAARHGLEVFEVTPSEAKKAVSGRGSASKHDVRAMVTNILEQDPDLPLDASDALSIALCYLFRRSGPGGLSAHAPKRRKRRGARWTADDLSRCGLEARDG